MKRLVEIIGLAPSELTYRDLIMKIQLERERALFIFSQFKKVKKAAPKGKKLKMKSGFSQKELTEMCSELDISMDDLILMLKQKEI